MKKTALIIYTAISFLIIMPLRATAQDNAGADELKLYVGETQVVSVNKPSRIVVGNPNIVDVTQATNNEVTLAPKAAGSTTLVIWDNFGEQSYRVKVLAEDMKDMKVRVDRIVSKLEYPDVYTEIAEEEGKIMLLGSVKGPNELERITTALESLKGSILNLVKIKEEEAVVDIDVQLLELNKDATNTLGFTWPSSITLTEKGSPGITGTKWSTLFKVLNLNRGAFTWTLNALIEQGKAKILSRPHIACQSGKEAELLVGGEKPIFTTTVASSGGEGTEVEYKEYGIKLKIKPIVTEDVRIKLALNVEVSEVGAAEFIGLETNRTAQAYPLTKRNASTELILDDNQTLIIGGLIKHKSEEDVVKNAGLGDIPVLGILFRKKTTKLGGGKGERGEVELFISLTPSIIAGKTSVSSSGAKAGVKELSVPRISSSLDASLPEPLAKYSQIIQKRILDSLIYPASAKEAGFSGTVKLSLQLSYNGQLLDVTVKETSGYKVLDDEAVSVAKNKSPYPPFPASLESKELCVDIPITYLLD